MGIWWLDTPSSSQRKINSFKYICGFPSGSGIKNLSVMQETWVWSLGWEVPLEKEMATHSSILAWEIPMDRGAWQDMVHGVTKRVGHYLVNILYTYMWFISGSYGLYFYIYIYVSIYNIIYMTYILYIYIYKIKFGYSKNPIKHCSLVLQ